MLKLEGLTQIHAKIYTKNLTPHIRATCYTPLSLKYILALGGRYYFLISQGFKGGDFSATAV